MTAPKAEIEIHQRIAHIGRGAWDSCAATSPANPFIDFDFLDILEESGCVGSRTGWA